MIRGRQRYKTHTGMVTQHNHLFPSSIIPVNLRWKDRCTAASWGDHSGNSNHASQSTTADQAELSGGGLDFESDDSSNHYDLAVAIDIDATHSFAMAFVCEIESMTGTMCLVSVGGTAHTLEFVNGKDKMRIKFDNTTTTITPGDGTLNDFLQGQGKFVITIVRDAGATGNIHMYKNGVLMAQDSQASNSAGNVELNTIGVRNSDRYFDGKLYDFIVIDTGSSTTDISGYTLSAMNSYLCAKHGISEERPDLS